MKLCLVTVPYPTRNIASFTYPKIGLAYIASYLKAYFEPSIKCIAIDGEKGENIHKRLIQEKPDVIGVCSDTLQFLNATRIATEIKSDFYKIPVMIGGVHISALPHTLPKCFDIGVIGEGEQTMLELVQCYHENQCFPKNKLKKIDGIVFHDKNKVVISKKRLFIEPLDKIPPPMRDIFDMNYYIKKRFHFPGGVGKGLHLITSRGCPYKCVFCNSPHFWKTIRFHSAKYVVENIQDLIEIYNVDCINILDDLFVASKKRLVEIVKLIIKEKINEKVKFGCQIRANLFDVETARLLKKMNMTYLGFGFETGSQKILSFLKKNTVTIKENKKTNKKTKAYRAIG